MVLINCGDDSIMYNNDINWKSEKPSNPTKDAIDRIWDRIQRKITTYRNEEIAEVVNQLKILKCKSQKQISIQFTMNGRTRLNLSLKVI